MKVMKASAGSGKTYNLSKTYIELLLDSEDFRPYRHILAVTFTNKATAEMKARILRDLAALSKDNTKARALLLDILHDYSAFAVSTIDKFFQQTLKAFSREIGQFADYKIELDRKSLIHESMDRILDSLSETQVELISWLKDRVEEQLDKGSRLDIESELHTMGERLKDENFRELTESLGLSAEDLFTKERISAIRKECEQKMEEFYSLCGMRPKPGAKLSLTKTQIKEVPGLKEAYDEMYPSYISVYNIYKLLFSLGLAREFYREFDALLKEKNLMCLDESNTILRDIIADSDAPFVYEKLGVRYKHFLLDEFQDTSGIQWVNFLPLLRESEAGKGKNLVVGDVKQSIYRFRGSDWRLLNDQVPATFPDMSLKVLDCNWRSTRRVVSFNNQFFTFAAQRYGLSELYSDVVQTPKTDDSQDGYVRVSFNDDYLAAVQESVEQARKAGARLKDIAVLVRKNDIGSEIADHLIQQGYSVISDDSLKLKSSVTVRRLVSLLSLMDNPEDSVSGYLAQTMGLSFPTSYHSLVDLCEGLLRSLRDYDTKTFEGETLFVQSFMDELQNYTGLYGNNLRSFLAYWDEKDPSIGSPEDSDSIRIMTIHKSKGLEFPYVIFPYKVTRTPTPIRWVALDESKSLPLCAKGVYPIPLSKECATSLFAKSYEAEEARTTIDNINLFYVALTRAAKVLHIIPSLPSNTFTTKIKAGKSGGSNCKLNELLYEFVGGMQECSFGTMYDFSKMKRSKDTGAAPFDARYESIPLAGRLKHSESAFEFFGEDSLLQTASSPRLAGIALHDLLSSLYALEDVSSAVSRAVRSGSIDPSMAAWVEDLLSKRIASHPDWFPASGAQVLNERSVVDADGSEYRPDRVIVAADGVLVIDFKFGRKRAEYLAQVEKYVELYRAIGYEKVRGVVWYVKEDDYVFV